MSAFYMVTVVMWANSSTNGVHHADCDKVPQWGVVGWHQGKSHDDKMGSKRIAPLRTNKQVGQSKFSLATHECPTSLKVCTMVFHALNNRLSGE